MSKNIQMQTNYMSRVARKRFFGVHAPDSPACVHVHDVDTETNISLLFFIENLWRFFNQCRKIFSQCSKETGSGHPV